MWTYMYIWLGRKTIKALTTDLNQIYKIQVNGDILYSCFLFWLLTYELNWFFFTARKRSCGSDEEPLRPSCTLWTRPFLTETRKPLLSHGRQQLVQQSCAAAGSRVAKLHVTSVFALLHHIFQFQTKRKMWCSYNKPHKEVQRLQDLERQWGLEQPYVCKETTTTTTGLLHWRRQQRIYVTLSVIKGPNFSNLSEYLLPIRHRRW